MWESEFFNETLIIFFLLFDVREQLLIRKKGFYTFQNCACYENVTQQFISKLGKSFCAILSLLLSFYPNSNPKESFLKMIIILRMCVKSHGSCNTAGDRQLDVESDILMEL